MPIVASAIIEDRPQRDGRRTVRERHTDHLGIYYFVVYLAEYQADLLGPMNARAIQLSADLAANEIAANIAGALDQKQPTNNYSTQAQNIAALRAFWATETGWDAARMGNFISSLNLSDVSLENVFGVSAGAQLTALKARLANCVTTYAAGIASAGQ